jgi:hypothetical protein
MKNKLYVIFVTLLILTCGLFIGTKDLDVKATSSGGSNCGIDDIGLDVNWMWNDVISTICNATYEAYKGDNIIRGREIGTKGDRWSANEIEEYMREDCGLENVEQIQLLPINDPKCWTRYYTSRMNVTDYRLHIDIDSKNFHKTIPVNESFVIPMTRPKDKLWGSLTFDWTLPDNDDIVIQLHKDGEWPAGGSLTNYSCKNLSISPINEFDIMVGNATYVELGDPLPNNQENRVLLIDEENDECEERLENVTNATGVLLIHEYQSDFQIDEEVISDKNY